MKIEARHTFDQVRHDVDTDAHLVISLTAPSATAKRPRIFVMPVMDVSGSMGMGNKMEYAKRSVLKLIDHLQEGDYCGLVAFDDRVRSYPPTEITPQTKELLKAEVNKLTPGGSTNFSGGFLKAVELMNSMDLGSDIIHRAIMFTDGYANCGVAQRAPELLKLLEANRGRVSVSAFGYGNARDCDQKLLTEWSKEGKGNYAYIENPDSALAAFGKELGGLVSTYATDVTLEVKPLNGHQIVECISDADVEEEVTGEVSVQTPDLLAEETRHLVFLIKFKEQKQAFPRAVNAFEVNVKYSCLDKDGKKLDHNEDIKAKVRFVKNGEQQDLPTKDVDAIVVLAQTAKAQLEAEEQANNGNFAQAQSIMRVHTESAQRRGHVGVANVSQRLGQRMATSENFNEGQGYLRSVGRGMSAGYGTFSADSDASADLQELGVVSCNASQQQLSEDFAVDSDAAASMFVVPAVHTPDANTPVYEVSPPESESTNSDPVKKRITKNRISKNW